MKKRYLLLRNNIERGPFTLDELLQQQLVPNDLLWVEGESHEWKYFREIIDLGFFKANNNEETIVYIETPVATAPIKQHPIVHEENNLPSEVVAHNEEVNTEAEEMVHDREPIKLQDFFYPDENDDEENIDLVYHKRTRTSAFVQLFVLAGVVALMAVGWNHNGPLFRLNSNSDQTAVPLSSTTTHTAKAENKIPAVTVPALATDTAKAIASDSMNKFSDSLMAVKQPEKKPEVVAERKAVKEVREASDESHSLQDQANTNKKPAISHNCFNNN